MTDRDPDRDIVSATQALLAEAAALYAEDETVSGRLGLLRTRLDEPLRIALAGRIKAGKSTLLNALVGEELAPTDTGECTRVVTWYRHGHVPDVTVVLRDGRRERRPVRRAHNRLQLDTGGHPLEDVSRIEVTWPSPALTSSTVIDTPGLASLSVETSERTTDALTPGDGGSQVDAVLYLMRHLHSSDAELMEAFREATVGDTSPVGTLAVLSRADEIGGGRIDAMVSAAEVAARYGDDARVRAMALDVIPVAGLLAQGARTLRQVDFDALREIARLRPAEREDLFFSADRFANLELDHVTVATPQLRADLLDRLGFYGVRMGTALLRGPITDATQLARELTRRSGLGQLTEALTTQLSHRADLLKTRSALTGLEQVLATHPREEAAELVERVEALRSGDHSLLELEWLVRLRRGEAGGLDPALRGEAEQLLGAAGPELAERLALPDGTSAEQLKDAAASSRLTWRRVGSDPLSDPSVASLARAVIRTLDGALTGL